MRLSVFTFMIFLQISLCGKILFPSNKKFLRNIFINNDYYQFCYDILRPSFEKTTVFSGKLNKK